MVKESETKKESRSEDFMVAFRMLLTINITMGDSIDVFYYYITVNDVASYINRLKGADYRSS